MSVYCNRCPVRAECEALPFGHIGCQDNARRFDATGEECVRCGSTDTRYVDGSGVQTVEWRCDSCGGLFRVMRD